jgi:interferon gamma-inducible protein 30
MVSYGTVVLGFFLALIDHAATLTVRSIVDHVATATVGSDDRSSPALSAYGPFSWMKNIFHHSDSGDDDDDSMAAAVANVSDTAKVEIYYETQCPACLELLNVSLRQAFEDKNLSMRTEYNLYPFGNALMLAYSDVSEGYHFWHDNTTVGGVRSIGSTVGKSIFVCQHDEQECLGNMIQACAIEVLGTASKYVPFTLCMASYGFDAGIELSSYACGEKLGVDMDAVRECTLSRTGNILETKIGKMSDAIPNRDHTPFVMINGVHFPNADDGDLIASICASVTDPKPSLCSESTGTKDKGCGGDGGSVC